MNPSTWDVGQPVVAMALAYPDGSGEGIVAAVGPRGVKYPLAHDCTLEVLDIARKHVGGALTYVGWPG